MLLTEQAIELLQTGAPIAPSKTDKNYQFVVLRSEGKENEEIAVRLHLEVDEVAEIEEKIVNEFLS